MVKTLILINSHSFLLLSLTRSISHHLPQLSGFMAKSKVMSAAKTAASWGSKGLAQLKVKYSEAPSSQTIAKLGVDYYKHLLKKNETCILEPPTVANCQLIAKSLLYTRLASIPHRYEAFWKELEAMKQHVEYTIMNPQEWKVEKAGIVALFGVECCAWSCGGEIVGRGFTLMGYKV